ncbi:energy transducer TonB [Flavobacterium sp.]|uniref:energy transducer TonB n=1 Tax=Flavobacterium sp. TaxID=239 RepID=UPI0037532AAC
MKKLFFIIVFGFQFLSAQEMVVEAPQNLDNNIYNTAGIDVLPEYPGGIQSFYNFIGKNFIVPEHKDFKGGKVIVSFVIEKDGSITDIIVIKDAGFGSAEEAIRVFKLAEKWKPAEQNGKIVRCSFVIPISMQIPK